MSHPGAASALPSAALRANLRLVLEHVTIVDVASGDLPDVVLDLTADPQASVRR